MIMRLARLLGAIAALLLAGQVPAAEPYAPAVIVNDAVITEFDVAQRMRVMETMGFRSPTLREQAVESLIDDRLRAQAARELRVTLDADRVEAAIDEFARQRNMSGKDLVARLGKAGVTRQAVIDLVENQAAFREAMRLRFLARATPTESEIEAERARGPGIAASVLRLAEIVLVVRERGEIGTQTLAAELYRSLSAGGDFAAAARKYSRSPTGKKGGDLGWLPLDRLPPSIVTEVAALKTGEVTRPIPVPSAVVILKVVESRAADAAPAAAPDATVTLARLVIPLAADASETDVAAAQVEAERIAAALRSCADVDARKKDYGPGSGTAAPAPLRSLPDAEREAVTSLAPGKASPPVRTRDGMAVLVVCARTGPASPGSLEQIRNRIVNERMVSYATGYLQELRRDAVIEYR